MSAVPHHSLVDRAALALLALLSLGGCASVRVDAAGQRHIVGLVWLTLPPVAVTPVGAETLRVRSLGLGLASGPLGQSAVLGYSDQSMTTIRNDSTVRLSAPPTGDSP